MISLLKSLFNNGDNNGNIILETNDKNLKCHDFVLRQTSDFFKENLETSGFNGIINLDSNSELVCLVLNYFYSEKIIDKELSANDIIKLYYLINQLRCQDSILILKNHYFKKFYGTLNEANWLELLKIIFNISKYTDLQDEILLYFKNSILMKTESLNVIRFNDFYKDTNEEIKNVLFSICLEKIMFLLNEVNKNQCILDDNLKKKNNLNNY